MCFLIFLLSANCLCFMCVMSACLLWDVFLFPAYMLLFSHISHGCLLLFFHMSHFCMLACLHITIVCLLLIGFSCVSCLPAVDLFFIFVMSACCWWCHVFPVCLQFIVVHLSHGCMPFMFHICLVFMLFFLTAADVFKCFMCAWCSVVHIYNVCLLLFSFMLLILHMFYIDLLLAFHQFSSPPAVFCFHICQVCLLLVFLVFDSGSLWFCHVVRVFLLFAFHISSVWLLFVFHTVLSVCCWWSCLSSLPFS